MRVVNPEKARMRTIIINDLKSNITNLNAVKNSAIDTSAIIANILSGSVVGVDQELTGHCQRIRELLDQVIQGLNHSRDLAEQLDITEEAKG